MIGAVIGLILLVVFLGFIWWAVQQLLPLIPVAEPFNTILRILLALVLLSIVMFVIVQLLALAGIHVPWPIGR